MFAIVTLLFLCFSPGFGNKFDADVSLFPDGRPIVPERTFTSKSIDSLIDKLSPLFVDSNLATLFSNCLPNTLDTTVNYFGKSGSWDGLDSFIITGDITALWLRDSANQVIPYAPYISEDSDLKDLFVGLINRHAHSILIDSFANAFNFNASGDGHQDDSRIPPMGPSVFEGKYEIDSLCAFLKISYWTNYYGNLTSKEMSVIYGADWYRAVEELLNTVQVMITSSGEERIVPYMFSRETTAALDTTMLYGRGPPARLTGLTRSMFRPSDDGVTFPYNIPGNAMACSELTHLITLLQDISAKTAAAPGAPINTDIEALMKSAKTTKASICNALKKLEESVSESSKPVFPYEMDGYGNRYYMDDANIPSLLSLPVLGYMSKENLLYASTRAFLLSNENPYYFNGSEAFGIGGPHVGYNYTWPMSIITIAMTSDDDEEILKCLEMLKKSAASTGFMHESFNVNDVNDYTRSWFAWANGLFGELLLQLIDTKPYLIIKADYIALAQTYVKTPVCVEAQLNALV